MKKISSEQISKLYAFVKQHYVPYYDLQTELVDHLANSIENQWKDTPNKSFEDALQASFKTFGIFGFTDLLDKRQAVMIKKYGKLVLKLLKEYVTLPKIALTLLMVLILYMTITFVPYKVDFVYSVLFLIWGVVMVMFLRNKFIQRKRIKSSEKRWLFQEVIDNYSMFSIGLLYFPQFYSFGGADNMEEWIQIPVIAFVWASVITVFILLAHIITCEIPKKAKMYIAQEHPEYNIV